MTIYNEAVYLETAKIIESAVKGDYLARGRLKNIVDNGYVLNESISTSDLVRTLNRVSQAELEAQYASYVPQWDKFAKKETWENFLPKRKRELMFTDAAILDQNGGRVTAAGSLPAVPEGTEYPAGVTWTTSEKQREIFKSGMRVGFTFEAIINDEWDFIQSIPGELFKYARNTEETQAIGVIASATGPNASFFNSGNQNAVDNKPLTLENLKLAKKAIRARKVNGNFVTVDKFVLVVTQAMKDDAEALMKIGTIETVQGVGSGTEIRTTEATSNGDVELVVDDYLTKVDLSAKVNTTWYLLPAKGNDGVRDTITLGFLRNHEAPQYTIATSGHSYAGGGQVPWQEGSLRNDTTESRIRHIVSGGYWSAHSSYASTGS